ncbi:hypothetical protein WDU94_015631, partial [Cyamophila willieti]
MYDQSARCFTHNGRVTSQIRKYYIDDVCSEILGIILATYLGYKLPWEDEQYGYPSNFASPLNILIEASNGASDYGNKFGEPLILGFARSYGQHNNGERREWIKPIMFSGGIGSMKHELKDKASPSV